jgi:hypothetical protein
MRIWVFALLLLLASALAAQVEFIPMPGITLPADATFKSTQMIDYGFEQCILVWYTTTTLCAVRYHINTGQTEVLSYPFIPVANLISPRVYKYNGHSMLAVGHTATSDWSSAYLQLFDLDVQTQVTNLLLGEEVYHNYNYEETGDWGYWGTGYSISNIKIVPHEGQIYVLAGLQKRTYDHCDPWSNDPYSTSDSSTKLKVFRLENGVPVLNASLNDAGDLLSDCDEDSNWLLTCQRNYSRNWYWDSLYEGGDTYEDYEYKFKAINLNSWTAHLLATYEGGSVEDYYNMNHDTVGSMSFMNRINSENPVLITGSIYHFDDYSWSGSMSESMYSKEVTGGTVWSSETAYPDDLGWYGFYFTTSISTSFPYLGNPNGVLYFDANNHYVIRDRVTGDSLAAGAAPIPYAGEIFQTNEGVQIVMSVNSTAHVVSLYYLGFMPQSPTNLTVRVENDQAILEWSPVTHDLNGMPVGTIHYNIYYGSTPDFTTDAEHLLATTDQAACTIELTPGAVTGFYKVRAAR